MLGPIDLVTDSHNDKLADEYKVRSCLHVDDIGTITGNGV